MPQLLDMLSTKEGVDKSHTFYGYIRRKAWEKGIPLTGSFELTPRCTLDCKMCYVHLNNDQMRHAELTTEQWIQIIDEAYGAGMMFATLTGGECLLHPGFKEIYEHLQSLGILVTVLTNGTLLDEEMAAWLAKRSPMCVQISVYGSSPKGYETVTGNSDAYYKVDKAIELLKKYGIPFNLAITISKQISVDFEATYKYCKSKEPGSCNVTTFTFAPRKETERVYADYSLSLDELVELIKARIEIDGKKAVSYSCEEELHKSSSPQSGDDTKISGISCAAGRSRFSISWDGRMLACNAFNFAEAFPFVTGFKTAWEHINKRSREYGHPSECMKCIYKRSCIPCTAIHWLSAGEGQIDLQLCNVAKRFSLEGFIKL